MIERREWQWAIGAALGLLVAAWLPYLVGWMAAPPDAHFTGLVYNPLDGHTYIAKMRLGAQGSWLFRLTYTPEPQTGAPIYLFYLFLGHLARWTHLSTLAIYHITRTAGGLAFLLGLYRLAAHLTDKVKERRLLFLLATLGAGLGWLAAPLGRQTPDLWVAEAFPFLALLTNAHFPAALALMVWSASWGIQVEKSLRFGAGLLLGAVALGAIQPFGLVPLSGALLGTVILRFLRQRGIPWRLLGWIASAALAALPYPLYTWQAIQSDPLLAAWNAQNVTPSPSLGDWLLGLGLLVPLALVGTRAATRRGGDGAGLLLGWVLTAGVGLILPLTLARRLSIGLGAAVGMLAGLGWQWLQERPSRRRPTFTLALLTLAALTPLLLLILGISAALGDHPLLYLSQGEWAAMAWLEQHAPQDAVVLCAPQTGIFIPAWAGQRVVYGHPFETINAAERRAQVEEFWSGQRDPAWLDSLGVDYIFYGPREQALGPPPVGDLLFEAGNVAVYHR